MPLKLHLTVSFQQAITCTPYINANSARQSQPNTLFIIALGKVPYSRLRLVPAEVVATMVATMVATTAMVMTTRRQAKRTRTVFFLVAMSAALEPRRALLLIPGVITAWGIQGTLLRAAVVGIVGIVLGLLTTISEAAMAMAAMAMVATAAATVTAMAAVTACVMGACVMGACVLGACAMGACVLGACAMGACVLSATLVAFALCDRRERNGYNSSEKSENKCRAHCRYIEPCRVVIRLQ